MISLHSFHYFCKAAAELLHLCDPVATLSNFCIIVSFETSLCMAQHPDSIETKLFCCRCRIHWRCVTWLLTLLTCRSTFPHALQKKNSLMHIISPEEWNCALGMSVWTHRGRADTSSALISHVYCVMIYFVIFSILCGWSDVWMPRQVMVTNRRRGCRALRTLVSVKNVNPQSEPGRWRECEADVGMKF